MKRAIRGLVAGGFPSGNPVADPEGPVSGLAPGPSRWILELRRGPLTFRHAQLEHPESSSKSVASVLASKSNSPGVMDERMTDRATKKGRSEWSLG